MKVVKINELNSSFFEYLEPEITVDQIIKEVWNNGDKALVELTQKYDNIVLNRLNINITQYKISNNINPDLLKALNDSAINIERFAKKQISQIEDFDFEIKKGVYTGQRIKPIERVGIYVPGGNYPLVSSLLMCAIPARVAGVKKIIITTPPNKNGSVPDIIIAAAKIAKIDEIFAIGGAQAIAAMAYGTESVPQVDKIVGPGNKYVTAAKRAVYGKVGIDFLAGPTEVLIIADKYANPTLVSADLLAQAEHDLDAVPILLTNSKKLCDNVCLEIKKQISLLKTRKIAKKSIMKNGIIILCETMEEMIKFANKKAPEHLELFVKNTEKIEKELINYGTIFCGENAAEALGDYSSGLNHTLPTNRSARYTGGLSVFDFVKISTSLRLTSEGLNIIGPTAELIAESEGLDGHKKSIAIRNK